MGFWGTLPKPFMVLAPMADVTDAAYRSIIARYSETEKNVPGRGPVVLYTEFVSADGLFLGDFEKLQNDLVFSSKEHPIVAQFFSKKPELMEQAGKLASERGFDGVDINMGCPDKNVCKQGAGAAMIRTPELACEIIRATKKGAGELPVSVKTRLGYNSNDLATWLPALLSQEPAVITLHARTKKEMSKVPADWNQIKKAVEIRDAHGSKTLIVGNGDVKDMHDARQKAKETGCDGVMLGRAIFGNPWLFSEYKPSNVEKLLALREHTALFEKRLGGYKAFHAMKRHFKSYVGGFNGAQELRKRLMECTSAREVDEVLKEAIMNFDISTK